jgi:hypothetical protein
MGDVGGQAVERIFERGRVAVFGDTKGDRQKLKNGRQTQTRKAKVRYRFRA